MPSQEDIDAQRQLLAAHRRTLSHYLQQRALQGATHVVPAITHGIDDARDNIRRIKEILREWGIEVADLPNDFSEYERNASAKQAARTSPPPISEPIQDDVIKKEILRTYLNDPDKFGLLKDTLLTNPWLLLPDLRWELQAIPDWWTIKANAVPVTGGVVDFLAIRHFTVGSVANLFYFCASHQIPFNRLGKISDELSNKLALVKQHMDEILTARDIGYLVDPPVDMESIVSMELTIAEKLKLLNFGRGISTGRLRINIYLLAGQREHYSSRTMDCRAKLEKDFDPRHRVRFELTTYTRILERVTE